ncbi:hypothetical protein IU510_30560 [Nocardia cyriacigeorgica]|uniref:hypothetical protein n=1 Tax=Nocardia cyriacigeorgica TaxID=135487 RepID=UPI00189377D9|nr:hypothetical protein [Nocardia cyriacigeorgica]MBF6102364.1 hypothetical protein [Nocardia cyriacigeorgica]MBF6518584.1 hypothetical protein [Nocardia cyriacigeorgica]
MSRARLNAEDAVAVAYDEFAWQRRTVAELLGQVRNPEAEIPEDGVLRLIAEGETDQAGPSQRAEPLRP